MPVSLGQRESTQPSLSDEQALELGRLALKLDAYFGEPQDIEWAIDSSRPHHHPAVPSLARCLPSPGHETGAVEKLNIGPSLRSFKGALPPARVPQPDRCIF
jgi:hypothetical protein